jgi:hypothetical protein
MHFEFNAAHGNTVDHIAVINPRPSWCNQCVVNPANYLPQPFFSGTVLNSVDYPKTVSVVGLLNSKWLVGVNGQ